jgi:cell division protein FtsN
MAPPAAQGAAATATTATPRPVVTPSAPRAGTPPQAGEPAAAQPARPRVAAIPPSAEGAANGFVVQLSSQKTEGEAQSSFRSLQAKFPNELGGRQPLIRRADLGSKGVFYRTMIGPFASAQEASQFCATYKAAGGQCVVPNN